jgi:hypothetical protein
VRTIVFFAIAYALPRAFRHLAFTWALNSRNALIEALTWDVINVIGSSYAVALFFATLLVPLGFLARSLARGRVRAGLPDPLDRARAWTAAHPKATKALLAAPALAWTGAILWRGLVGWTPLVPYINMNHIVSEPALMLVSAVAHFLLARAGLRALLAPTLAPGDEAKRDAVAADEITFDAVAVTLETRAAVAAMAVLPFVFLFTILYGLSATHLSSTAADLTTIAAYIATTVGGVLLFRRASRIAIGVDGVLVKGSSRTRFFAYRDLDEARVRGETFEVHGADIELVRGGRVVIRLQLHGEDATRRDAIVARLRDAIAAAHARRGAGAEILFQSASRADDAGRASVGAGDYRQPAPSREQLWEVLEGGAADATARTAAAAALATSLDADDRARLRVAAAQCAEPRLRVALEGLAADDDRDERDDETHAEPARLAARET